MATVYLQKYPIPNTFPELLHDYMKSILKEQPSDIIEYSYYYFKNLSEGKQEPYTTDNKNNYGHYISTEKEKQVLNNEESNKNQDLDNQNIVKENEYFKNLNDGNIEKINPDTEIDNNLKEDIIEDKEIPIIENEDIKEENYNSSEIKEDKENQSNRVNSNMTIKNSTTTNQTIINATDDFVNNLTNEVLDDYNSNN